MANIWIHNNASSSGKSLSSLIKIHWHVRLELFWTVFTFHKRCLICAYFSPDSDKIIIIIYFFTGESNIMDRWLLF